MAAIDALASPRVRVGTLAAVFLLMVGAILGSVPGWQPCFLAWKVLSWFALASIAVVSLCDGLTELTRGDLVRAGAQGRQVLCMLVAAAALSPLGRIADHVGAAEACVHAPADGDDARCER